MSPAELAGPLGLLSTAILGGLSPFLALPLLTLLAPRAVGPLARATAAIIEDASSALGRFAQACLLLLLVGMLTTVALRYVFGESFTKLSEATLYAHALAFLFAAPAALLADQHVRVDIFYGRASPRGKAWIDFAGFHLLLAPVLLLLLAYAGPVVEMSWRVGEGSPETDGLPLVFALKTAIPIFATVLIAAGVATAVRAAFTLREPAEAA